MRLASYSSTLVCPENEDRVERSDGSDVRGDGAVGESSTNSPGSLGPLLARSQLRRTGASGFDGDTPGGASEFDADALRGGSGAAGCRDDEDGDEEELHHARHLLRSLPEGPKIRSLLAAGFGSRAACCEEMRKGEYL